MVEAASIAGRRYSVLNAGTAFSASFVPSGMGDRVSFIANAAAPPTPPPTMGMFIWSQASGPDTALFAMSSSGRVTVLAGA